MELDSEEAANYEQLKELIQKEFDKCDQCYATLKQNYKPLKNDTATQRHQQKTCDRGASPFQQQTLVPPSKTKLERQMTPSPGPC